jgi:hypothetical protein
MQAFRQRPQKFVCLTYLGGPPTMAAWTINGVSFFCILTELRQKWSQDCCGRNRFRCES